MRYWLEQLRAPQKIATINVRIMKEGVMLKTKLFKLLFVILFLFIAILLAGCGQKDGEDKASLTESGMKCGAGKCGASMVDGNTVVAKKKKNILSQMRENDPRKSCVLRANSAKALYECVRSPKTGKLTRKCGIDKCSSATDRDAMKCAVGKCSSGK